MPLTSNLYREDEVLAALRHSIVAGNVDAALFWTQEGIESDMDVRIFQTLLSVWLHCVGLQNIHWLGWLVESLRSDMHEETILSLVTELARSPKDSSVFVLEILGLCQTPDHVGAFTLPPALQGLSPVETTFAKAVLQGKTEFAWALAGPLWSNERADAVLWEIQPAVVLNQMDTVLEPIWTDEFVWPFRALSVLMATSKRDFGSLQLAPLPAPSKEHMGAWTARKTMRMRERRQLSIPPECLFWFTERGSMRTSETTEMEMMGGLRPALAKSPFWEDRPDFDEFMTSDIPDEWSSAARRVSHGPGVLGGSNSATTLFETTLKTMFSIESSRVIWKGGERATKILMERWVSARRSPTLEAIIQAEYDSLQSLVEKWDLSPRRVVISS
jgi:hypothetical protein